VAALTALKPYTFTLDGEVAVFDAELVSRFEWLRHINHGDLATPPLFMVFDLLQLGEKDYRPEPLKVRRKALEKLVKGQALILPARRLSPNGFAAWTEVLHRGYEGMVAKPMRPTSVAAIGNPTALNSRGRGESRKCKPGEALPLAA
jgi:ATP-dependent DNA ligase